MGTSGGVSTAASVTTDPWTSASLSTTEPITSVGPSTTFASTTEPASSSTDGTSHSGSSSETTGPPPHRCTGFIDDFNDGMIDGAWDFYAGTPEDSDHFMGESGSELRWEFSAGVIEQVGVAQILDHPFGHLRIHVTEAPFVPMSAAQLVLSVREYVGDTLYAFVWAGTNLSIRDGSNMVESLENVEWVEVEYADDGSLVVSVSDDGVTFTPEVTLGGGIDQDDVWITIYGQTWTPSVLEAAAAVGYVEICEP